MKSYAGQCSSVVLILLSTAFASTLSQAATTKKQQQAGASTRAPATASPASSAAAELATKSEVERLQASLSQQSASIDRMSVDLGKVSAKVDNLASKEPDYTAAVLGALAVLAGAGLSFYAVRKSATTREQTDLQIAAGKAKGEVSKSMVDWRLKQLAELYGPLRTLFAQSNAIYRTMNMVVAELDPSKFRLLKLTQIDDTEFAEFVHLKDEFDNDGHLFAIKRPQVGWKRFRTVLDIDEVYNKNFEVELYFERVADISVSIVDVITTKAGLALDEQDALVTTAGSTDLKSSLRHKFGQYLAHAAVLQAIHANRRAKYLQSIGKVTDAAPLALSLATHESAKFPQHIQKMVDVAYLALQQEVAKWASTAKA